MPAIIIIYIVDLMTLAVRTTAVMIPFPTLFILTFGNEKETRHYHDYLAYFMILSNGAVT